MLSEWEMQEEDLPAGQTLDEEDIFSDDASDEDWEEEEYSDWLTTHN